MEFFAKAQQAEASRRTDVNPTFLVYVIFWNQISKSRMWFYLLVLDFTQGFFFLAIPKPTANESFSVGIMLLPLPVLLTVIC